MGRTRVPYPSVGFPRMVRGGMQDNEVASQILNYSNSGELTTDVVGFPLGTVTEDGKLNDFVVSVANQGRDDDDTLNLGADLKLNGVSVLDSEIDISGASGEAPTYAVGDEPTFTTTDVVRGDRLSLDLTLTRATPSVEIKSVFAAVKITPVYS